MKPIIMIVAVLLVAFFAYIYLQPESSTTATTVNSDPADSSVVFSAEELTNIPPTYNESIANTKVERVDAVEPIAPSFSATAPTQAFVCDHRKHCSQMTSCAEATYFNKYCSGTKMDGNNDGVPCEQQWCN